MKPLRLHNSEQDLPFWAEFLRAREWFAANLGVCSPPGRNAWVGELMLPLPDDYALRLTVEPSGDWLSLTHPLFDRAVFFGHDDGHPMLDALRGEEVELLVSALANNEACPVAPRFVPLLLHKFTAHWEIDRARVLTEWRSARLVDEARIEELYDVCLARSLPQNILDLFCEGAAPRWWRNGELGWVTNAPSSVRRRGEWTESGESVLLERFFERLSGTTRTGWSPLLGYTLQRDAVTRKVEDWLSERPLPIGDGTPHRLWLDRRRGVLARRDDGGVFVHVRFESGEGEEGFATEGSEVLLLPDEHLRDLQRCRAFIHGWYVACESLFRATDETLYRDESWLIPVEVLDDASLCTAEDFRAAVASYL